MARQGVGVGNRRGVGDDMSDKRIAWWTTIKTTFVFWLAGLANRHLGVMVLYWTNPLEWEEYMRGGEQLTSDIWEREE